MNKQIQKFAEQAGYNGHYCTEEFDLEMFAELIVKECAQKFAAEPDRPFYGRHVAYEIQKHFGLDK